MYAKNDQEVTLLKFGWNDSMSVSNWKPTGMAGKSAFYDEHDDPDRVK